MSTRRVIVVGCGVSGLTCGVMLAEAGYDVQIWARDLPPNTTSNVAAAIWEPYKAYPEEQVTAWGKRAYDVFCGMAGKPGTGVALIDSIEVWREPATDPPWSATVHNYRRVDLQDLPSGYVDGYTFETPVIEMGVYLDYMTHRFRSSGSSIIQREVNSLDEASREATLVVNCSGLGSRSLVADDTLFPIRGQVVRVARPEGVDRAYLDHGEKEELTYIVPRSTDCILGGTSQLGNWSLEPDMATAGAIIERCALLVPALREAEILEHRVGLRPGRSAIRLETQQLPGGKTLVHNYGHGGAGVTLSWGCAEEVLRIIESAA